MSEVPEEHRRGAPKAVRCVVVTVSDTRTMETDTGGQTVVDLLEAAGHEVVQRHIVRDEPDRMKELLFRFRLREDIEAILMTGGTGLGRRDRTVETVGELLTKSLPGYGELFRTLSYQEIGAAAMLSRAIGGVIGHTIVLTMPGSRAGVKLAMEKLILPELGHMVGETRR